MIFIHFFNAEGQKINIIFFSGYNLNITYFIFQKNVKPYSYVI